MQLKVTLRINSQPDKTELWQRRISSPNILLCPFFPHSLFNTNKKKNKYIMLRQTGVTLKRYTDVHTKVAQTTNIFRVDIKYSHKSCLKKLVSRVSYLNVYMTLPLLHSLSSRLGVVIQWASDFREFLKKVSGIQILPTMLLLSISSFIVLLNFNRLSYHVWAKKMSMVYSCKKKVIANIVSC